MSLMENLFKWYKGLKPPPQMVQIYPTNKCNLKCIFCVQRLNIYNLREEVSKRRWLEIVKEICGMGVRKFLVSGGGEPLCTPNKTFGIMEVIKFYGGEGRMITSGFLWNKSLIEKTIKMGWDSIMFSFHGVKAKTHDRLTGVRGSFNKVIKNIELFMTLKEKLNSEVPSIEFTFVLNKLNFKEVPDMIKLAHNLGVEGVNIEPLCINNKDAEKIKLNKGEREDFFKEILPQAEKLARKLKIRNNFERIKEVKFIEKAGELKDEILKQLRDKPISFLNLPCYEPWLWPKIEANGEVWPCSTVQLKSTNIKTRGFKEIWYGKEFEAFRKRILRGDLPEECNNCVLTHLPIQRKIRKEFKNYLRSKLEGN